MENNNIIKSFELQDELNPKIWIKQKGEAAEKLKPEVREKLLEIAYEFIQYLNVDVIVSDVHLTGSLSNYNWSQYSDFDLHIIADFNQFPKSQLELYKELFTLKKTLFNSEHNIKLFNYDVELYVQDENEKHTSSGVFSLITNKWLEKPRKETFKINKSVLKSKIDQWTEKIDKVLESADDEKDLSKSKKIVDGLKDKIKKYRKTGLDKGGEMSYENLVFKYLRRSGHIEKLFNYKKERVDKELSIKESANELRGALDNLGYEEKNSEISSGGEISGEISKIVSDILTKFKNTNPKAKVRITAGNDVYHKGTNSQHPKGLAVDLTVEPPSARSQFKSILDDFKKTNSNFKYADEYTRPSKRATGGHFHLQIGGEGISTNNIQSDKIKDLYTQAQKSNFLESLKKIAQSRNEFGYQKVQGRKIQYKPEVEKIQIALQFLGYSLPRWGVDGLFGPETKKAVENFQSDNNLNKTGILSQEDLQYLYALLLYKGFQETDLTNIEYDETIQSSDITQTGPITSDQVISFFVGKGLTSEQSAAIAGNLFQESNLNPSAINKSSGAFGLAQWYKDRFDGLKQFLSDKNMEISNPNGQLEYIWQELQTTESKAFRKFLLEKNIGGMVRSFARNYERMGVFEANMRKRISYAKQFLNRYNKTA